MPILSETVECLAVPAVDEVPEKPHATGSSASSSSEKPSSAPLGEKSPAASHEDVAPSVHPKSVPGDEPLVLEPDESKELVGTSRVRDVSPSPSLGGEGGPPENPPSSEDDGEEAVKTLNHSLTHFPKSKHCEICMRAKMTSRHHRKRGDPDPDEKPPLHFGHQLRVDHIIIGSEVSKGSEGEQACLICHDEYRWGLSSIFPNIKSNIKQRSLSAEIRWVESPWSCVMFGRVRFSPRAYRSR